MVGFVVGVDLWVSFFLLFRGGGKVVSLSFLFKMAFVGWIRQTAVFRIPKMCDE